MLRFYNNLRASLFTVPMAEVLLPGNASGNESDTSSQSDTSSVYSNHQDDEVVPWFFSREDIDNNSPSRRDGIDLKTETRLRNSYCTFLNILGKRLKL